MVDSSVLNRKVHLEMGRASCAFPLRHEVENTGTQVLQLYGYHPEAILKIRYDRIFPFYSNFNFRDDIGNVICSRNSSTFRHVRGRYFCIIFGYQYSPFESPYKKYSTDTMLPRE